MATRASQSSLHAHGWSWSMAVVLIAGALMLSVGATPAGAIVAEIGGHGYGVTPIEEVNPASMPGARPSPGSSALSGAVPRNFDGAPQGGGLLLYHGGPVMRSNTTHVIFWDPSNEFTATTRGIVGSFFTDVAHDSGLASNVFGIAGQYTDTTGNAAYSSTFGGASLDADSYPTSGNCTVPNELDEGPPYTKCLFDSQLQGELSSYINEHSLPKGPTQLYFLLLPHKVVTCVNESRKEIEEIGQACSNNVFCAYHSYIAPGTGSEIIYAAIPFSLLDTGFAKACQDDGNAGIQQPNPDSGAGENSETRFADVALKYISHEYNEAITDPLVNNKTAWVDGLGLEIGDKCNGVSPDSEQNGVGYDKNAFLLILGGSAGADNLFDQSINTSSYYLQSEWDNAGKACLMEPMALSQAAFTPPTAGVAGSPVAFSGSASDPYGAPGFTWSFGDGGTGTGTSPTHTYAAPGEYTVTMTPKDGLTDATAAPVTHKVLVSDVPTASFTISANPATVAMAVGFDGSTSNDSDGSIVSYAWSFGDGSTGSGPTPSHAYGAPGLYTVRLIVTDSAGLTSGPTNHSIDVIETAREEEAKKRELEASAKKNREEEASLANAGFQGTAGFQVNGRPSIPDAKLASTALRASLSGIVLIKVSCPAGESSCSGTVTLHTLNASGARVAAATHTKATVLTLATGSFTVSGGTVRTVTLHLSAKGRALLARSHMLRVRATIVAHDPAGARHTAQTAVTLRAPKAKHGNH